MITMVIDMMIASSPGTMLMAVTDSGLYWRCTTSSTGDGPGPRALSGPVSASRMAVSMIPCSAATGPPVAEGSDASAASRICGLRPLTTSRSKPDGMTTTKFASPVLRASSPSATLRTAPRKSK